MRLTPPNPHDKTSQPLLTFLGCILDGGKELGTQYNLVTPLILLLGTPESGRLRRRLWIRRRKGRRIFKCRKTSKTRQHLAHHLISFFFFFLILLYWDHGILVLPCIDLMFHVSTYQTMTVIFISCLYVNQSTNAWSGIKVKSGFLVLPVLWVSWQWQCKERQCYDCSFSHSVPALLLWQTLMPPGLTWA